MNEKRKQAKVFDYQQTGPAALTPNLVGNETRKLFIGMNACLRTILFESNKQKEF